MHISLLSLKCQHTRKLYLDEEFDISFPTLDDFSPLIINFGANCFLWRRDLSRFFLQLPLDPGEYDKVVCIWRGQLLLFTSFVWGTRHAGMNGQRVKNAVSCIHRALGFTHYCSDTNCTSSLSDSLSLSPFNTLKYSDDFAGVEETFDRATLSF